MSPHGQGKRGVFGLIVGSALSYPKLRADAFHFSPKIREDNDMKIFGGI